jgi:hypothetical protein
MSHLHCTERSAVQVLRGRQFSRRSNFLLLAEDCTCYPRFDYVSRLTCTCIQVQVCPRHSAQREGHQIKVSRMVHYRNL